MLQQKFPAETEKIFMQLEQFRDGPKSIEVFTSQNSNLLPRKSVSMSLFQQILQFLSLKDEIIQDYEDGKGTASLHNTADKTADILQRFIYDQNYLSFLQQRKS